MGGNADMRNRGMLAAGLEAELRKNRMRLERLRMSITDCRRGIYLSSIKENSAAIIFTRIRNEITEKKRRDDGGNSYGSGCWPILSQH